MSGINRYAAQNFIELLDCPRTYVANNIIQVNSTATGLIETPSSSIIPPIIGTGIVNDIPMFTGGVPILADSGFQVGNISVPNPPNPLDLQVHYLNLNPSAGIDQVIASLQNPNIGGSDLLFIGVGAMTGNADLQISNQSVAPNHNLGLSNNSPMGTTYVSGETAVLNNNNNITMQVNQNGLGLYDGLNGNYMNFDNTGINMSSNTAQNINMYVGSGSNIQLDQNNLNIYNSSGNNSIYMDNSGIDLNNNGSSSINLNKDLSLNTNNNLHINVNGSTGLLNQVLTADGASNASWQTLVQPPNILNMVNAASLSVPAGAAWVAHIGAIPFNDVTASYAGYQNQLGTNVSYNNLTHTFTVNNGGWFNVRCAQTVNTENSLVNIKSDGRLALYTFPGLVQVGVDSGRFEVTNALSNLSLSFQLYLDIVVYLNSGDYQVWATGEPQGLLLGKNSCTFQQLA